MFIALALILAAAVTVYALSRRAERRGLDRYRLSVAGAAVYVLLTIVAAAFTTQLFVQGLNAGGFASLFATALAALGAVGGIVEADRVRRAQTVLAAAAADEGEPTEVPDTTAIRLAA